MVYKKDGKMLSPLPAKLEFTVGCSVEEFSRIRELEDRRLYLYGQIAGIDNDEVGINSTASMTSRLVEQILDFNRADIDVPTEEREPVRLYINSPGGDVTEGFALVSAIELSKTPIYTINVGQWSSMAFLIGIAGHKRYSLPYSMFLMHDGTSMAFGSTNKVKDEMEFNARFENNVIKPHVLKHSNMKSMDYDALARVELYMLPEEAKERGFIDVVVDNINDIL